MYYVAAKNQYFAGYILEVKGRKEIQDSRLRHATESRQA